MINKEDISIIHFWVFIWRTQNTNFKDKGIPMFNAALYTMAMPQKQPTCPLTNKWIKKRWYTLNGCTHTHIYKMAHNSVIKEGKILPLSRRTLGPEGITPMK